MSCFDAAMKRVADSQFVSALGSLVIIKHDWLLRKDFRRRLRRPLCHWSPMVAGGAGDNRGTAGRWSRLLGKLILVGGRIDYRSMTSIGDSVQL